MSIHQLFEVSRRSFQAFDARMNAAGQNVANAATEGYHRRRIALTPANTVSSGPRMPTPQGTATGVGVSVESYARVRDGLLESAAAEARTGQGAAEEEARILSALEGLFASGSGSSLPDALGDFSSAWSDVANHPNDRGVRAALLSRTDQLTGAMNQLDQNVARLTEETQQSLATGLGEVNAQLDEVAALNQTIQSARASGSPDLVAEDRRDALVKELSAYAPVRVRPEEGGYTLTMNGMNVVQGQQATHLEAAAPPAQANTEVRFAGTDVAFRPAASGSDGKVGAWLRTLNDTLPDAQRQFDGLAQQLVEKTNAAHATGFDADGNAGGPFFDPAGVTAGTIQRAVASPDGVAAIAAPDQPGDTTPARNLAAVGEALAPAAVDLIAGVGAGAARASADASARASVANHLDGMARGVSGVSIDEEMTQLIESQQAFAASARVLDTAKTMMDTLLAL